MTDKKLTNCLLGILTLILCTLSIWTINYITDSDMTKPATTISAFNA